MLTLLKKIKVFWRKKHEKYGQLLRKKKKKTTKKEYTAIHKAGMKWLPKSLSLQTEENTRV